MPPTGPAPPRTGLIQSLLQTGVARCSEAEAWCCLLHPLALHQDRVLLTAGCSQVTSLEESKQQPERNLLAKHAL